MLDFFPGLDDCNDAPEDERQTCKGKESVLRLTGATFAFFILHAIALLMLKDKSDFRRFLHNACWIVQVAIWVVLVVVAFVLPSSVFLVGRGSTGR